MNNTYSMAGLQQHHNAITQQPQQHAENMSNGNLLQSSPAISAVNYMQQQLSSHYPQQQISTTMAGTQNSTATLYDPRELQNAAILEKPYYTEPASVASSTTAAVVASSGQFFSNPSVSSVPSTPTAQHNTILITNNFPSTTQQHPQRTNIPAGIATANTYNNSNIRILSTAPSTLHQHGQSHPQHVYGMSNIGKEAHALASADVLQMSTTLRHQQQHHLYQQQQQQQLLQHHHQQQQQQLSAMLPQHSAQLTQHLQQQDFTQQSSVQPHTLQLHLPPTQQFYLPTDSATQLATTTTADKLLPLPTIAASSGNNAISSAANTLGSQQQIATQPNNPSTGSTVVLDRINICINNHYTDAVTSAANMGMGSPALSAPAQQPSPIIPAIQHKAVVDSMSGTLIDSYTSSESNTLIIDEPDSTTTTPHTPPTTPENSSPISTPNVHSPCKAATKLSFADVVKPFAEVATSATTAVNVTSESTVEATATTSAAETIYKPEAKSTTITTQLNQQPLLQQITPLTPPTPPAVPTPLFNIGEDVFIKRQDGRFYLGTIIDSARQQFLVCFDDKSELWCGTDEMRKFGGGCNNSSNNNSQMCLACKSTQREDIVEICERCGRGYHRSCTTETSPGNGDWLCKRCAKPMKVFKINYSETVCRQLPYHVDTLNWDEKHRVNEEQIYCYCGQSGQFDHNMLQCCKCRNWFHTHCMQCFKSNILRGDGFFVFCCSVCNDGVEFLRRLQLNWIDLTHLALYNLSAMKKHQHHKYHHLSKDIWPFVLEKRMMLPIPREWIEMPEAEFMEKIKSTLKENTDRFICGREIKRDHYYYALRNNGPPILPKFNVSADDLLTDQFLTENLKLILLKGAQENVNLHQPKDTAVLLKFNIHENANQKDVYEFRVEDDEKFTSDDEIPIKHILDKVKKNKSTEERTTAKVGFKKTASNPNKKIQLDDENANDANGTTLQTLAAATLSIVKKSLQKAENKHPKQQKSICNDRLVKHSSETYGETHDAHAKINAGAANSERVPERSSRKRKAFTLSKSYKEIAAEAAAKRYECTRICDSSSDENSSSSRGTSLDLIIPPPKNFLGLNNPFRMVTPKKNCAEYGGTGGGKKTVSFGRSHNMGCTMVKNSIFNTTTTLDFSSKLAALKNAGIFSNFSTSNLAKAAGQSRTVRTIKRRLSAKDITIGPNQEVRRRRTRRLSSNVEVISTTTINPIPSNFFPIHAKDLLSSTTTVTATTTTHHKLNNNQMQQNVNHPISLSPSSTSASSSSPPASSTTSSVDSLPRATQPDSIVTKLPTHGRRLRQRPQKISPSNSRRSSISGASTSSNQSNSSNALQSVVNNTKTQPIATASSSASTTNETIMQDLKQSVNKYFGVANRIESGEQFSIRAKRQLATGQMQFLIEWGGDTTGLAPASAASTT